MIGEAELAQMKAGAYLINLSRGTVVDLDALAAALKAKKLGGAALDVYPEEPESNSDDFTNVMRGLPNVILTPHIGGSTHEAQESIGREVASSLTQVHEHRRDRRRGELPAARARRRSRARTASSTCTGTCPACSATSTSIVSDRNANILGQILATDPDIGYLVMDLDKDVANDVRKAIAELSSSIKTRILY